MLPGEFNQRLEIIENALLEQVHRAGWERGRDNSWMPKPENAKTYGSLLTGWNEWSESCKRLTLERVKASPLGARLEEALREAQRAVEFKIPHTGAESTKWRIVFEYERAFRILRECVLGILIETNEVDAFIAAHKGRIQEFRDRFRGDVNIFVAINYSDDNEVEVIRATLSRLSEQGSPHIRFHYASDTRWLSEMYGNLRFYMVACDAGLIFLTKSNATDKGFLHNPNVAFEFGFMCGLGKKCLMIRHVSINAFTDVQGMLYEPYDKAAEIKAKVIVFLRDDLGVNVPDGSAA